MNFPVFDFHCDTALALLGDDLNQAGSLRKNNGHIDLERAGQLGGYAQCFACFTTDIPELLQGISPIVLFERELATIQREVDKNNDLISIAYSADEIEENREAYNVLIAQANGLQESLNKAKTYVDAFGCSYLLPNLVSNVQTTLNNVFETLEHQHLYGGCTGDDYKTETDGKTTYEVDKDKIIKQSIDNIYVSSCVSFSDSSSKL